MMMKVLGLVLAIVGIIMSSVAFWGIVSGETRRRSITVNGTCFIIEPMGRITYDKQKIWTDTHPEYFIWRYKHSHVWTISKKLDSVVQQEGPNLKIVPNAGCRKAAHALAEYLFDTFVAPSILNPDDELLRKYGCSDEHPDNTQQKSTGIRLEKTPERYDRVRKIQEAVREHNKLPGQDEYIRSVVQHSHEHILERMEQREGQLDEYTDSLLAKYTAHSGSCVVDRER